MKKFVLLTAFICTTFFTSCNYDDSELWSAVTNLNSKVEQNSDDIATLSALVEALNKGKVIISTEYTDEGVKLTFSDNSTVTIKNGANGKDGQDGADGKDGKDGQDGDSFFVSIDEDENSIIITLADGRVIVLPKYIAPEADGNIRVLTFEDEDVKFNPYTLDYAGVTVNCWSDIIDPIQYGGTLLYDNNGGIYSWADSGNTELSHSFATPYWTGGHALSNYVITDYSTLPEGHYGWFELQLATPIGGHNGSKNFCIHNGYKDDFNTGAYDAQLQGFAFSDGVERVIDHMYITNTCYVLNSLTYGDGFAPAASEGTFYKVVAYGYDTADNEIGSVEFSLCEGRKLVTTWEKFDLSPLGKVAKVLFNFEASDDLKSDYGVTAPAYFAYDDVAVQFE